MARLQSRQETSAMTTLVSRNIVVDGRRTSMRLEPGMWDAMEDVCRRESITVSEFCSIVNRNRGESSLTAATRVCLLSYFRDMAEGKSLCSTTHHAAFLPRWQAEEIQSGATLDCVAI